MKVTPIHGEPYRFHVTSSREGHEPYLVDVSEHNGIGQCGCYNWQYRLAPKIAAGERLFCKHVEAAREYLLDRIIAEHLRQEKRHKAVQPQRWGGDTKLLRYAN